jgi:hypothetical protein
MEKELTSHQIAEWIAYDRLEPFGEPRADLRNAILCRLVASLVSTKEHPAPAIKDFMPDFDSIYLMDEKKIEEDVLEIDPMDLRISRSKSSSLILYGGDSAPAIKKIGKRAKNPSKKVLRLREILKKEAMDD